MKVWGGRGSQGPRLSLRLGEKMKDEVGVLRVKAAGAVWGWNNTWEELGAGRLIGSPNLIWCIEVFPRESPFQLGLKRLV